MDYGTSAIVLCIMMVQLFKQFELPTQISRIWMHCCFEKQAFIRYAVRYN
jgi:hypothetical protein